MLRYVDYLAVDRYLPIFYTSLGAKHGLADIRNYTSQMEFIASGK